MFVLVASDNFLVLFAGWEGIGICSFLLINFWHTRLSATKAALKAIILNRIGDSAFIASVSFLFFLFKSCDFSIIFSLIPFVTGLSFKVLVYNFYYVELISLLFVIGSVGKSAQLGLHGWLPEAMEGPTPVSALIHAATLVTAGVFLIIRCSPIIEHTSFTLNVILFIGGLTCLFGSTVACAQNDLKRIIAFSTTSQLGYMFFACGLSAYNVALFHLLNHGFFKALLFLCAGSIIFTFSHEQDIRKLGGLITFVPFVYSAFLISFLALIGFPFLSGFYSKELLIELSFSSYNINSFFIYWVSSLSACLTSFYGSRALYLTFLVKNNSFKIYIQNTLILGNSLLFALFILIFGSVLSGLWFKNFLVGLGSTFFGSSIYIASSHVCFDYEFVSWSIKNLPLFGALVGFFFSIYLNFFFSIYFDKSLYNAQYIIFCKKGLASFFLLCLIKIKIFLNYKWFLDFLTNNYFGVFFLKNSYETCYKVIDKGILEIFIINGLVFSVLKQARNLVLQQNGYTYSIICFLFICFILILNLSFFF